MTETECRDGTTDHEWIEEDPRLALPYRRRYHCTRCHQRMGLLGARAVVIPREEQAVH